MKRLSLPVDALLPEIAESLKRNPNLVLRAPTGSGKTTRVPVYLEEAGFGPVVILEPRRLAARAAARRMASERGEEVGESVGYRVRFDAKVSKKTRITAVTEGVFLRRILADPFLEGVGCVVFDEFHERHLDGDLALALARRVQSEVRPDLKIVVLSATLDPTPVAEFLGQAQVLESEGRLFPVETHYQPAFGRENLEDQVARGVRSVGALLDKSGEYGGPDILVFLPGMREIQNAEAALGAVSRSKSGAGFEIVRLHGDLSPTDQDAALRKRKSGDRRRVILSTNLAESSVTLDGIGAVIDSGLARIPKFDAGVGLDRLELCNISLESVRQRAGRAGRTGPGLNLRLWSALEERAFSAAVEPEVTRVDLAGAWLQLHDFGETDPAQFDWFEVPPENSAKRASELLLALGATTPSGAGLTPIGKDLARLPLAPRLGRLLLAGRELGCIERTALAAALLGERDPLRAALGEREPDRNVSSDLLERIELLEDFEDRRAPRSVRKGSAISILQTRDQLLRIAKSATESAGPSRGAARAQVGGEEAFLQAVFIAFADRLARMRVAVGTSKQGSRGGRVRVGGTSSRDDVKARLVGGRGVRIGRECRVRESELIVCVDLDAGSNEGMVRQASSVEMAWLEELDSSGFAHGFDCEYDVENDLVRVKKIHCWRGLALSEIAVSERTPDILDVIEQCLAAAAQRFPERAFNLGEDDLGQLVARYNCLAEWKPELEWTPIDARQWAIDHAGDLARGRRSFGELRKLNLAAEFVSRLEYQAKGLLDREAPSRFTMPNKTTRKLLYEAGRPPILAAPISQFFGWTETPKIAGGRVPLLLHLCSPNGRPQQVTGDLAGFWRGSYELVRKELRGRYPKQPWPENPQDAGPVAPRTRRN
mgnify:CR=1 FL=1